MRAPFSRGEHRWWDHRRPGTFRRAEQWWPAVPPPRRRQASGEYFNSIDDARLMTSTPLQAEKETHLAQIERVLKGGPPIVCFANDWRGDPTSKHHIMRIFAEYTDVIWVESSGMRRPNLLNLMDLRRSIARLKRVFGGANRDRNTSRLHVLSPLSIPLPGNWLATKINGWLYR